MELTQSEIWRRILETGDIKELEYLLRLVIHDDESIRVIIDKFSDFLNEPIEFPLKIQVNIYEKRSETIAQNENE